MRDCIAFYIHRTGLLNYFIDPICIFLEKKYDIIVLNIDKCNGYSSQSNGSYKLIDISDYSISQIEDLLKMLSPKSFILLGFVSIFELLMLRISLSLNLKTIYLEHGIYSKETSSLPLNKIIHRFRYTVEKNIFFLHQYRKFIKRSKNAKLEKKLFYQCVLKKDYSGTKFSNALFFAEYGYKKINSLFSYDMVNVDFTCYPLSNTNKEFAEYSAIANKPLIQNKQAIYIHQPFILDGLATWTYEEERQFLLAVAKGIYKYGYKMNLLIHPRENTDRYKELYKDTCIVISQNIEKKQFKNYDLAIGHYSTALLYPLFFYIPMVIIDYGVKVKAKNSVFYPLNCELPIIDSEFLINRYDNFREEYIGKGICSFENIAKVLDDNIQS